MKTYIIILIGLIYTCMTGCNDEYYHDSGLAKGDHDCSMLEYMQRDNGHNWDSTVVMIYHAGLENLYAGKDADYSDGITFFGPTNASIRQYILKTMDKGKQKYFKVSDIPAEDCKRMLLSHTIVGKRMMDYFDYEQKGTLEGGSLIDNLIGNQLRIYRIQTDEYGIPNIGAEHLGVHSKKGGHIFQVVSCNIRTLTGIVHSTDYILTEL